MLLPVDSRASYLGVDGIVQADQPDILRLASSLRHRPRDDMGLAAPNSRFAELNP